MNELLNIAANTEAAMRVLQAKIIVVEVIITFGMLETDWFCLGP